MAQKVRKHPESELLAIKLFATIMAQKTNLKLKSREREQTLKLLDPPKRQVKSEKKSK